MSNKTCGDCKHYFRTDRYEFCNEFGGQTCEYREVTPNSYCFEPKLITNGDKIRQMSNAELARLDKCDCCIYFGGRFCEGVFCEKPGGKTCTDGREAWLNAPAESEGEDE